jgi:hypothetical protein
MVYCVMANRANEYCWILWTKSVQKHIERKRDVCEVYEDR